MNLSTTELAERAIRRAVPGQRRTAVLVRYDDTTGTGLVAPVVNPTGGQTGGPYRVDKALQVMPDLLRPGVLVTLERLTDRTIMITSVVNRPIDTGLPHVAGGMVDGSAPTSHVRFHDRRPTVDAIAWDAGAVTFQGETFRIDPGDTSLAFVIWQRRHLTFTGSATLPADGSDDVLVAVNRSGVAVVYLVTGGVDGETLRPATVAPAKLSDTQTGYLYVADDAAGTNARWVQAIYLPV